MASTEELTRRVDALNGQLVLVMLMLEHLSKNVPDGTAALEAAARHALSSAEAGLAVPAPDAMLDALRAAASAVLQGLEFSRSRGRPAN